MKGCWLFFHKWGKWLDGTAVQKSISGLEKTRAIQARYCEKCGLRKVRFEK